MGNELKERVSDRAAQGQQRIGTGGEVARQDTGGLEYKIRRMEDEFGKAMPQGAEAAQLIRDALTAVRGQPNLAKADPNSVLGALMTCAQLNLRVGVLGQAWVLPFKKKGVKKPDGSWDNDAYQAQLIIGYQGYEALAYRSGLVSSFVGRVVYENDYFDVDYGIEDKLIHKPARNGPRGAPTDYYAIIKFTNGGHVFWTMNRSEVEGHRDRFAMARDRNGAIVGPWRDNFDSMAIKTQLLQAVRFAPKSADLAYAVAADETVRLNYSADREEMLHGHRPQQIDAAPVDEPDGVGPTDDEIETMNREAREGQG